MRPAESLSKALGSLIFKGANDIKGSYNRGDPETAGGDLAYAGKQWMDMPGPTGGSNAPMEEVRKMVERRRLRKKKTSDVTYE